MGGWVGNTMTQESLTTSWSYAVPDLRGAALIKMRFFLLCQRLLCPKCAGIAGRAICVRIKGGRVLGG
jgi:hypothetical protein